MLHIEAYQSLDVLATLVFFSVQVHIPQVHQRV